MIDKEGKIAAVWSTVRHSRHFCSFVLAQTFENNLSLKALPPKNSSVDETNKRCWCVPRHLFVSSKRDISTRPKDGVAELDVTIQNEDDELLSRASACHRKTCDPKVINLSKISGFSFVMFLLLRSLERSSTRLRSWRRSRKWNPSKSAFPLRVHSSATRMQDGGSQSQAVQRTAEPSSLWPSKFWMACGSTQRRLLE